MEKIIITKHAEQRIRERCGLNHKSAKRMAERAWERGIKHSQTKGRLNKWVTGLYFDHKTANNIRLYGDKSFIFCKNKLITVIQIPADLRKDMDCMIERGRTRSDDKERN